MADLSGAADDVGTYELVQGVETLRQLPNLSHSEEAIAIKFPSPTEPSLLHTITYRNLHDLIEQTATALVRKAGIVKGDVVALAMPNNVECILGFLAVPWARAVSAPLNPDYTEKEFAYYMEDNKSKCLLVPASNGGIPEAEAAAAGLGLPVFAIEWDVETLTATLKRKGGANDDDKDGKDPSAEVDGTTKLTFEPQPDDVALFLHTSGTTARPKVRFD